MKLDDVAPWRHFSDFCSREGCVSLHVIPRTWMGSREYSRKERPNNNHPWISRLVCLGVIGWKFLCPFSGGHYERVLWREALQKLAGFSRELHGTYLGVNVFVANLDWWLKGPVTSPKRTTFCMCFEWDLSLSQKSFEIRLEKWKRLPHMLQVFFAFVTHAQDTNINGSFDPMAQLNPPTTVPWSCFNGCYGRRCGEPKSGWLDASFLVAWSLIDRNILEPSTA